MKFKATFITEGNNISIVFVKKNTRGILKYVVVCSRYPGWEGMPKLSGGVGSNRYAALNRFQPRTVDNPALESGCPTRII